MATNISRTVALLIFGSSSLLWAQTITMEGVVPVPVESGKASLSADNAMIQFVGTHAGDEPNPRVGVFQKFSGVANVTENGLESIQVEIDAGSLQTPIENLTNHLKSPDFFDVREHSQAKFVSSKIEQGDGDQHTVTGNLTIMGKTKKVEFPARIEVSESGVTLDAKLTLDRTDFGMSKMTERVNKEVELTIAIGKPSQLPAEG